LDLEFGRRRGAAGRRRVEQCYSVKAAVDIMIGIYERVLQQSREGRRSGKLLTEA
jgi:hypothetical protein